MKFPYVDYKAEMVKGMRFYHTPHGAFPSITTVLGGSEPPEKTKSLESWRLSLGNEKTNAVTQKACDHGTMVHLLIERHLAGEDPFALVDGQKSPQPDISAFNALKLKLKLINEVWGQEQALYSPSLEVAGRLDCVGEYKHVPSIIDFKTSMNKIKSKDDIKDYNLQLAFYARAHNELYGTDIKQGVILMVAQTGFPLEFIVDLEQHYPALQDRISTFWTKVLANYLNRELNPSE
jgi:genome maintenance exonuclease 1